MSIQFTIHRICNRVKGRGHWSVKYTNSKKINFCPCHNKQVISMLIPDDNKQNYPLFRLNNHDLTKVLKV